MRIRIRDLFDPGSGMEKFLSGIRYKHPGTETLTTGKPKFCLLGKKLKKRILCFLVWTLPTCRVVWEAFSKLKKINFTKKSEYPASDSINPDS